MNGWLPESFEQTPGLADRIASGVKARNHRRKRLVREAWAGLGGVAVVAVVAVLVIPAAHITAGRAPGPKGNPSVPSGFASGTLERYPSPTTHQQTAVGQAPSPASNGLAMNLGSQPGAAAPRATAPDLTLLRVDHSVELAWQGNKNGEYVVYRCASPKFDQCSLADKVRGTKWVDSANEPGITYYMVEPTAGNGRGNG